jgi:hypothetical protein
MFVYVKEFNSQFVYAATRSDHDVVDFAVATMLPEPTRRHQPEVSRLTHWHHASLSLFTRKAILFRKIFFFLGQLVCQKAIVENKQMIFPVKRSLILE